MTPQAIPARFLAGSTDPATAYTVAELRELLAELPGWLPIVGGSELSVRVYYDLDWLSIRHAPGDDVDDLDSLAERHDTGGES